MLAEGNGQGGPDGVVSGTDGGIAVPAIGGESSTIALVAEILDDFVGIEGKETSIVLNASIDGDVG